MTPAQQAEARQSIEDLGHEIDTLVMVRALFDEDSREEFVVRLVRTLVGWSPEELSATLAVAVLRLSEGGA